MAVTGRVGKSGLKPHERAVAAAERDLEAAKLAVANAQRAIRAQQQALLVAEGDLDRAQAALADARQVAEAAEAQQADG